MGFSKYFALIAFSLLFLSATYAVPGIPHQFYGFVTVNGAPAHGIAIVAKINGVEFGRTASINGNYGYDPSIFYVEDPDGSNSGKTIEFFLSGSKVATYAFETGASTRLDLSIGVAPFCGDGSCSAGETCSSCSQDCGSCPTTGGDTGGGGGGGGGGGAGGGGSQLAINISGNCVNQPIAVTILNTVGKPAPDATVSVQKDRKTIETKKTSFDGKLSFTFSETGEYEFGVTKSGYTYSEKAIALIECKEEGGTGGEETGGEGAAPVDKCKGIDCDDKNPCTVEHCVAATGYCSYGNQQDNVKCSATGVCQKGECVEPVAETGGVIAGPTGFFGLGFGQTGGAGLVVIGLLALLAYLFAFGKRKKKK